MTMTTYNSLKNDSRYHYYQRKTKNDFLKQKFKRWKVKSSYSITKTSNSSVHKKKVYKLKKIKRFNIKTLLRIPNLTYFPKRTWDKFSPYSLSYTFLGWSHNKRRHNVFSYNLKNSLQSLRIPHFIKGKKNWNDYMDIKFKKIKSLILNKHIDYYIDKGFKENLPFRKNVSLLKLEPITKKKIMKYMLRYGKSETKKWTSLLKNKPMLQPLIKSIKNLIRDTQIPLIKSIPLTKKNEKNNL